MEKYKIADIRVDMNIRYDRLKNQSKKYLTDDNSESKITIDLDEKFLNDVHEKHPYLTIESLEYIYYGSYFYNKILDFDGFLLHSSAICKDNEAYLFSAKSGTGKSTHTQNWLKYFNNENIFYINDDKPAIRKINDEFYCCGTPFSGKTDLSSNTMVKIKAITFIVRGENNSMKKLTPRDAISRIISQTVFNLPERKMNIFLNLLGQLLEQIPIYELTCNMDVESAKVAYEYIKNN